MAANTSSTSVLVILFSLAILFIVKSTSTSTSTHVVAYYSNVSSSCRESEREALVKIREGLTDPANRLSSWIGKDCCAWKGVGCGSRKTGAHVLKLDLRKPVGYDLNKMLGGEISPSLLKLKHLNYLDLSWNNLTYMPILDSLKSLTYLDLSGSMYFGQGLPLDIPYHLGNLSRLRYLDLSSIFYVALNPFAFPITLCNLSSLVYMDLSGNSFNGPIPHCLGSLTSLTHLDLSGFESSIPSSLCKLNNLVHLDLSGNSLNGSIPRCLGNQTSLSILRLSSNSLHGPLPIEMGNMTQLIELDLSGNEFEGEIPNFMRNLCNLRSLNLAFNKFNGLLPSSLGRLSNLTDLCAKDNQLHGSIPSSLWELSKLEFLDLSNNFFVGILSEVHFAKLKSLTILLLSNNSLVLNVSSQWIPPFQLNAIELASCKLGTQFPSWLQTQTSVFSLVMSNASISDTIPDWFENIFSCIDYLDLSNNNISGKLPKFQRCNGFNGSQRGLRLSSNKFEGPLILPSDTYFIIDLSNNLLSGPISFSSDYNYGMEIYNILLSNNQLTGGIPKSFCKTRNWGLIDLSKNQLSGRIPQCFEHFPYLLVLALSDNHLYGHIPSSLGSLPVLVSLHLRNNRFQGKLPSSLQNLTRLTNLDLGENAFTDIIPPWIGNKLHDLKFLNLESNKFYGDIPAQLCRLSNLQQLNLAQNNITGNIPRCFYNFTAMVALDHVGRLEWAWNAYDENILDSMKGREREYTKTINFLNSIDLSDNHIVGEIPKELMMLIGLRGLNLSSNHLKGRIPDEIGNLKQLGSLDLSRNKLFGPIPPSLSSLTFLNHLNLSFNNLSGRIPTGNQLQTLNDQSTYAGNDGLCGEPLPKHCSSDKSKGDHENVGQKKGEHEMEILQFYEGIGPGFLVGFLGVCGTLHFKKSWRHAFFMFVENGYNWIVAAILVKTTWLRRKFRGGKFGE